MPVSHGQNGFINEFNNNRLDYLLIIINYSICVNFLLLKLDIFLCYLVIKKILNKEDFGGQRIINLLKDLRITLFSIKNS